MPSPAHLAQHKQMQSPAKAQHAEKVAQVIHKYDVGSLVYALYFGPRRDRDARWVPAVVTKRKGTRTFNVKVVPRGPTWRRHFEQLQPRHHTPEDDEPGHDVTVSTTPSLTPTDVTQPQPVVSQQPTRQPPPIPADDPPVEPRRSKRRNKGQAARRYSP